MVVCINKYNLFSDSKETETEIEIENVKEIETYRVRHIEVGMNEGVRRSR